MEFSKIALRPISYAVLQAIYGKEPLKASEIAEEIGLKTRQVDAAVTKSLVRYGFCIREAKLTRLMKKEYYTIRITERGSRYIEWKQQQENKTGE